MMLALPLLAVLAALLLLQLGVASVRGVALRPHVPKRPQSGDAAAPAAAAARARFDAKRYVQLAKRHGDGVLYRLPRFEPSDAARASMRAAVRALGASTAPATPVVLWHGMGDFCDNPLSMGALKAFLEEQLPAGTFVYSICVGDDGAEDEENGFLMPADAQVKLVCAKLQAVPQLANKTFNAIGFSQGGQFLRGLAERCAPLRMRNLVTLGGQHQGVYGLPKCPGANHTLCEYVRELLDVGAYWSWIQDTITQANYWHDPYARADYRRLCHFLPDVNDDAATDDGGNAPPRNDYRARLAALQRFVMVKFTLDTIVQPRASEHFGFYDDGQAVKTHTLQQSPLYARDALGLKTLDRAGKLTFVDCVGDHLQFSDTWFVDNVIKPYLLGNSTASATATTTN